jgi:hypothetical protein
MYMVMIKSIDKQLSQQKNPDKKQKSFFASLGFAGIETTLNKIPFIGKALPFLLINLLVATIFYYLCYGSLWLFSSTAEEDGRWFVRKIDYLGKSHSRLTTYAAEQIAYFVGGFAACLFTYANFNDNYKNNFLIKTALVLLIPLGFLVIGKIFASMPVYIPMAYIYGQFAAIVVASFVKLVGGDKIVKNAKS